MGFMGYKRPDGQVGVRNHVLVMSSVSCVNGVVNAIGRALPEVKAVTHTEGCGRGLADIAISNRSLIGLGKNPNVAGVLMIGLGCEFIKAPAVAQEIAKTGKPVSSIVVQEEGGTRKATARGIEIAGKFLEQAAGMKREECGFDKLMLGLECGGSDALSGVTANPLVGELSDWLVGQRGTVLLSETTEMIGAEHVLARRAKDQETGKKILELVQTHWKKTEQILGPLAGMVISPGNIEGGLSSIMEKSLGCIVKAGTTPVNGLVEYGAQTAQKGLVLMDTPGSDIFSMTGEVAGGAQIIVFTTGRGTPAGFPIAPVIKISSNSEIYEKMKDDIDLDAGRLLSGTSMKDCAGELIDLFQRVLSGEKTKAEINLQEPLSIHTVGPAW